MSEGNRSLTPAFWSRFPDVAHGAGEYDLVSVVIPVYNRGGGFDPTLART